MKADNPAARKLLASYKTENVILKASLLEVRLFFVPSHLRYQSSKQKQKQEESTQAQISELRCQITKLEEELELSNYHNERLTKRVTQLMEQLKNPVCYFEFVEAQGKI